MVGSIEVRPVQLSDAARLNVMCWYERTTQDSDELLQRTQKLAFARRGLGAVALFDGALCGFGLLTMWPGVAEISDLVVNARYRRRGIGSALITYLGETARKLGADTLEIGVALSNPRALALYRRLGFTDHHVIELDLGNGPELVLYLRRTLPTRT